MFQKHLARYKRTHAIGQIARYALLVAAILAAAVILYGLGDAIWALETSTRKTLNLLLLALATITLLFLAFKSLLKSPAEIATLADKQIHNSSRKLRAANDLLAQESPTVLHAYLRNKALDEASAEIKTIPLTKRIPVKAISFTLLAIGAIAATAFTLKSTHPEAFSVITKRIFHPTSDTPPFTNLKFDLSIDQPSTLYGGENLVKVSITGDEIKHPVTCLIRDPRTGEIETVNTFQENENTFTRKFTNIVNKFDVAFSCGKSRSHWLPVEVLLQPKFTSSTITINPPAYVKRKSRSFPLEGNEIKVIEGSTITLDITSNRPLAGGTLTLAPITTDSPEPPTIVKATANNTKTASFTWTARRSATLSCIIHDVRSTPSASSLDLTISTLADMPPTPEITSPPRLILATPKTKLPLRGQVSDDYAIDSVSLVRTLVGFRDRATDLASTVDKTDFDFTQPLDLEALGVAPDQTLEFYLEARDKNPSLLGIGSSDIVRVHIISEDDYAARIRAASTLSQFLPRYRELSKAIDEARASLQKLQEANRENEKDKFLKTIEESIKAHQKSQKLANLLAKDFRAFELEQRLGSVARETYEKLLENEIELNELDYSHGPGENQDKIDKMLDRLGGVEEKAKELNKDADKVQQIGKIIELAGTFLDIRRNQRSLANRKTELAKEINRGITRNRVLLPKLGNSQLKNRTALLKFTKDLAAAAELLPDEAADLQNGCVEFLDKLKELDILAIMEGAAKEAIKGDSIAASNQAHLALKLLNSLVELEENEFADLLRGKLPKDQPGQKPDAAKTLEQMLQAMLQRNAQKDQQGGGKDGQPGGQPGGAGMGQGGESGGFASRTPMLGPGRHNFGNTPGNGPGRGNGQGGKGHGSASPRPENNTIQPKTQKEGNTPKLRREKVPEKYRDAVKKFYTDQ